MYVGRRQFICDAAQLPDFLFLVVWSMFVAMKKINHFPKPSSCRSIRRKNVTEKINFQRAALASA